MRYLALAVQFRYPMQHAYTKKKVHGQLQLYSDLKASCWGRGNIAPTAVTSFNDSLFNE